MPPFVTYVGLSRSQSLRIGNGPGNTVVSELNMGDTPSSPQTGRLATLFYADIAQGKVKKDIQHHSAVGAIDSVGTTSTTVYSDLFKVDGLTVTPSGSNMTVAVTAGVIASRFYGTRIAVPAATVTLPTGPAYGGQMNYVYVGPDGKIGVYSGAIDSAAPAYEVWSVVATGASAGTFTLQFQYNGFTFTTGTISYAATGANVATAVQAATGGPNNVAFSAFVGGTGDITGAGTALPTGPATVTFSGAAEGPVVPTFVDNTSLTGGTAVVTRTTVGTGNATPFPSGNALVLGGYYVTSATTHASAAQAQTSVTLTA